MDDAVLARATRPYKPFSDESEAGRIIAGSPPNRRSFPPGSREARVATPRIKRII